MARQTTLANLRAMFKRQAGIDASNTNSDALINGLLSDKQKWLATDYDWPFLETRQDVTVAAGARSTALPTMNFERPVLVERFWGNVWEKLDYGIGSEEYNSLNPDLGNFSDPIMRWRFNDEAGFEAWPVPVTPTVVRFTGQRVLNALASDSDTADLDDLLIVLHAAAEWLANRKQADAGIKAQLAQARLSYVRASYPTREMCVAIGGACNEEAPRKRNVGMIIAVRG